MKQSIAFVLATLLLSACATTHSNAPASATNDDQVVEYMRFCYTSAKALPANKLNQKKSCQTLTQAALPAGVKSMNAGYENKALNVYTEFQDGNTIRYDGENASFEDSTDTRPRMKMKETRCWTMDGLITRCCTDGGFCCTWIGRWPPKCH